MEACREITICYDYTFPGEAVNFTGESIYTDTTLHTVYLEWERPKPFALHHHHNKVLGKTWHLDEFSLPPLLPAVLHSVPSEKSQLHLSATCLGKKQIEESCRMESWFSAKLPPLPIFAYQLATQSQWLQYKNNVNNSNPNPVPTFLPNQIGYSIFSASDFNLPVSLTLREQVSSSPSISTFETS